MAAIDPNIALGVRPIQIENPMNQYAALSQLQANQNQNALAQYQLSSAKRSDEAQNVQNQLYAKHYDAQKGQVNESAFLSDLAAQGQGSLIPKAQAQFAEQKYKENQGKKIVSEIGKLDFDLGTNIFTQAQNELKQIDPRNPKAAEQYLAYRERLYANPALKDFFNKTGLTKEATDAQVQQAIRTPQGLADTILKSMTTAEQFQKILNDRRQTDISQQNANINAGRLNLEKQKFAFDTNPENISMVSESKKTGELNAADKFSKVKDVEGARKFLKTIGLDQKTGVNEVTKLIRNSTGSYLGAATDFLGRVVGVSPEGADAIGQLKTFETKLTLDLLNGKGLGAGISVSDREFMVAGLGQIADNTLPVDVREKAWGRVVERMKDVGLLDNSISKPNTNVSSGVDSNNPLLNPPKKK